MADFYVALDTGGRDVSLCATARRLLSDGYSPETIVHGTRSGVSVLSGVAEKLAKLELSDPATGGGPKFVPYRVREPR